MPHLHVISLLALATCQALCCMRMERLLVHGPMGALPLDEEIDGCNIITIWAWRRWYKVGGGAAKLTQKDLAQTGVPNVAHQKQIWLVFMRTQVRSLASLIGLRIRHCCELWCRSQMWVRSGVAVAVVWAGGCGSDSTLAWEHPYPAGAGLKRQNKQTNKQTTKQKINNYEIWRMSGS